MSVSSIDHVLVLTDDIEQTREFYCRVVGLQVGARPPLEFPGYWLYTGDTGYPGATGDPSACLHIADRRAYAAHAAGLGLAVPEHDSGAGPLDHVAFRGQDYDSLVARLESCGVPAVTNTVAGGPRQVFIEDPNGVRVEINVTPTPTKRGRDG
jgi:catechol 2,3-dioxygenase-like lactoylglutathione lyase family enzyme